MMQNTIDDQTLLRYLLGDLSEDRKEAIEERYFSDGEFFERLVNAEDELIHRYLRRELMPNELDLFERNFLSLPEKRRKVEFMNVFLEVVSGAGEVSLFARLRRRIRTLPGKLSDLLTWNLVLVRWAPATIAVILAFVSLNLYQNTGSLRTLLDQQQDRRLVMEQQAVELQQELETQNQRSQELAEQLQSERRHRTELEQQLKSQPLLTPNIVAIDLYPSTMIKTSRSSNVLETAQIGRAGQTVKLRLYLDADYSYASYSFYLETVAGDTLWSQFQKFKPIDRSGERVFELLLPAGAFTPDDYIIRVEGSTAENKTEHLGSYTLRIAK